VTDLPLELVHSIPGRLRARWRTLKKEPHERAGEIADRLVRETGVLDVTVHTATGSVLVVFDPERTDEERIMEVLLHVTGAPHVLAPGDALPPPPPTSSSQPSTLAVATAVFFDELNQDVLRATDGAADLRMLMPLGFVGLGLAEVVATGEVPPPPWWSLFWWSFRAFLSLNDPAIKIAVAPSVP